MLHLLLTIRALASLLLDQHDDVTPATVQLQIDDQAGVVEDNHSSLIERIQDSTLPYYEAILHLAKHPRVVHAARLRDHTSLLEVVVLEVGSHGLDDTVAAAARCEVLAHALQPNGAVGGEERCECFQVGGGGRLA